jgi:hypothetical protein
VVFRKTVPKSISPCQPAPGAIKIVQKDRSGGFSYDNEFWADGVRPKGLTILAEVLVNAFRDLGIAQTSVKACFSMRLSPLIIH